MEIKSIGDFNIGCLIDDLKNGWSLFEQRKIASLRRRLSGAFDLLYDCRCSWYPWLHNKTPSLVSLILGMMEFLFFLQRYQLVSTLPRFIFRGHYRFFCVNDRLISCWCLLKKIFCKGLTRFWRISGFISGARKQAGGIQKPPSQASRQGRLCLPALCRPFFTGGKVTQNTLKKVMVCCFRSQNPPTKGA